MTDLENIIKECRLENGKAQRNFFDLFGARMFNVCRRYLCDDQDANWLVNKGFLIFFTTLNKFEYKGFGPTNAWLKDIMVKQCLMFLRKKNKEISLVPIIDETNIEVREDIISGLSAKEIYLMITRLPERYRIIFNLFVLEKKNHNDIAKLLKISEGASRNLLLRARIILQEMLIQNNNDYEARKKG